MHGFQLFQPEKNIIPVIASIPHSGMWIPDKIKASFTAQHLSSLRNTDWYLDRLFEFLHHQGVSVLSANFSRYVVDVNRNLLPALFGSYKKCAIYETNTWDEEIYSIRPSIESMQSRIDLYYTPYHSTLLKQIELLQELFGHVILLDLHSYMGPINNDVCLGDRNGSTCKTEITEQTEEAFAEAGYDVVRNKVFSGGHIIKYYSTLPDVSALQIEMRYTTYLESENLDNGTIPDMDCGKFWSAQSRLKQLFSDLLPRLCEIL